MNRRKLRIRKKRRTKMIRSLRLPRSQETRPRKHSKIKRRRTI